MVFKNAGCKASSFRDLKETFNSVDCVHGYTIFNIGGNNYRNNSNPLQYAALLY